MGGYTGIADNRRARAWLFWQGVVWLALGAFWGVMVVVSPGSPAVGRDNSGGYIGLLGFGAFGAGFIGAYLVVRRKSKRPSPRFRTGREP